jgi:hypothetical protein
MERLISHYKGRFDWKKAMALAAEFNLWRVLYCGLYIVKKVFSADIPAEVLNKITPNNLTRQEKAFIDRAPSKRQNRYATYPVYLSLRNSFPGKLRFLFLTLFPPSFTFSAYLKRLSRLILS